MIRVESVTKDYGPTRALDSVSFEVADRQILGFLGPNGAGKSTAMKIITTYISPTSGTVTVDGIDVSKDPIEVRRRIGYLPETNAPLYSRDERRRLPAVRYCEIARRGLEGARLRERSDFVVESCGLKRMLKKSINELSKGYKQRTGLAQALIHDPKILILDEPTSGLDPLQIIEIRQLIQRLAQEKTIIFSTHILQEVSSTTDRVIIINGGSIIADGYISELQGRDGAQRVRATLAAARGDVEHSLASVAGVRGIEFVGERSGAASFELVGDDPDAVRRAVGEAAREHGWTLLELSVPSRSLERTFIDLVRESHKAEGGGVAHV